MSESSTKENKKQSTLHMHIIPCDYLATERMVLAYQYAWRWNCPGPPLLALIKPNMDK